MGSGLEELIQQLVNMAYRCGHEHAPSFIPTEAKKVYGYKELIAWIENAVAIPNYKGSCGCCGSQMVEIRGRYPYDTKRRVCPTCCAERLDQIREISDKNYGVASQERPTDATINNDGGL